MASQVTRTSTAASDDNDVVYKRMKKREMVLNEIMSSESVYLKRLQTLRDVYIVPIREGHILTHTEISGQFSQLESICDLHLKLYSELTDDFKLTSGLNVGKIFKDFSHFLKMYKQYLNCFAGGGLIKRAKLLSSNKRFSDFVFCAQSDPRCQGSDYICVVPSLHFTSLHLDPFLFISIYNHCCVFAIAYTQLSCA